MTTSPCRDNIETLIIHFRNKEEVKEIKTFHSGSNNQFVFEMTDVVTEWLDSAQCA